MKLWTVGQMNLKILIKNDEATCLNILHIIITSLHVGDVHHKVFSAKH